MRELDKEAMFSKDNIGGNTKTMRDKVITPIPLLSFAIVRQDHNTDTPFEFRHSQENNKTLTEAQVCYAHMAEKEQNKQNQRSEGGDSLEVTQKGAHMEFYFG